jgi:MFS family permease
MIDLTLRGKQTERREFLDHQLDWRFLRSRIFLTDSFVCLFLSPYNLTQLNMQAAYLISTKDFNEKQVGILFFVFGMSQFLCMAPAGYVLDYSNRKIDWVLFAGTAASALTVITALTAEENDRNMAFMIIIKMIQGGITAVLPPGFNGITLGIVGSTGFTHQVSRNRMMNHIGTALIVAFGSLIAYFLYPNIGALFIVSPLAAIGMAYNLRRIKPTHVDRDAARGLIIESPTMNEYEQYDEEQEEAAVVAAALSWQKMEDNPGGKPAGTETQTANSCCPDNAHVMQSSCPYEGFSSCNNDEVCSGGYVPPLNRPVSPAESATSSCYMPSGCELGVGGQYQQRNTMLLNSPVHENEEGYHFELRQHPNSPKTTLTTQQEPSHPLASTQNGRNGSTQQEPSHPLASTQFGRNGSDRGRPNTRTRTYDSGPSFNLGYGHRRENSSATAASVPLDGKSKGKDESSQPWGITRKARTPLAVLMDPTLMIFTAVIFFFHLSNSSVLPLVMQSLALEDPQAGILLSGLCILIAQAFMSYFAKICGDYSPTWGRKNLVLIGLASLTLRCFLLTGLVSAEIALEDEGGSNLLKTLILSTQFLDAVGAGIMGCLHILVTNDISGGTGRFSLMLGVTTGAMCLGGTVSGYIGQAIAQDYGYPFAFTALGLMSLVPFFLYVFFMPETLPDYARPNQKSFKKRRKRLVALFKKLSEHRRRLVDKAVDKAAPFLRRSSKSEDPESSLSSGNEEPPPSKESIEHPSKPQSTSAGGYVAPIASHIELV